MRGLLITLFTIGNVLCLELMPKASGLKSIGAEIRRAPVQKQADSAVPRAHGLSRVSTGIRRAPDHPRTVHAPRHNVVRQPLSPLPMVGRAAPIPLPPLVPMQLAPISLPTIAPLMELPTMAPLDLPTLPSFTMPPSFQRLMGITTKRPARKEREEKEERDDDDEEELEMARRREVSRRNEESEHTERNHVPKKAEKLSSVGSRLPKFIADEKQEVVAPEGDAEWIVPFRK